MNSSADHRFMRQALRLARLGQGSVEPNPMVGCLVVRNDSVVGEGWHERFGEAHAEINALRAAGADAHSATLYVTLEPCCHHGKTPPCTQAIIQAGIRRVVAAAPDPFPQVAGQGIRELQDAGIDVQVGLLAEAAEQLNAPYLKLLRHKRPWIVAKWAMTLDGKLASRTGNSQWISCTESRRIVHQLRGRVDAILVGSGTAMHDAPLLTARPGGPRVAARIVVDSQAQLSLTSQLVATADYAPVVVAVAEDADPQRCRALQNAGCEVLRCKGPTHGERLRDLLDHLGSRRWTNVMVEGGARVFGTLMELGEIDEVHAFVAPKLVGGAAAPSPIAGAGFDTIAGGWFLDQPTIVPAGDDVYVSGIVVRGDDRLRESREEVM
jgi:diaminohydroxyphosphoribosylaminopyrimidine deaminase/5-amino-6-(5-phosphoribosylamino)uracil reductase